MSEMGAKEGAGGRARMSAPRRAGDLSELLPPMMLGHLAARLFEGAGARQALGLITRVGEAMEGFGELGEAGRAPERGWLAGGKPLIRDGAGRMDVRVEGALPEGGVGALRLPVSWRLARLSGREDGAGAKDEAAVLFLALARCDPDGGMAVNKGLFGVYRFAGRAEDAMGAGGLGGLRSNGSLRVAVVDGVEALWRAAAEVVDSAGRGVGEAFVRECELTGILEEALNPAFYERRELSESAAPAEAGAAGLRRGL